MLKFKISKEDFEKLEDAQKALYAESGDGYQLQVEGLEDVSGLKAKVDELLSEKKQEQQKAREAEEKAKKASEEAEREKARKAGDVEALEASWKKKHEEALSQKDEEINSLRSGMAEMTSGSEATRLASSLAIQGSADLLRPHIEKRLTTEYVDGKPLVRVLDKEGKPSAMSVTDLETEIKSDPAFAPILVGSKGGGAGHQQQQSPGGQGGGNMGGEKSDRVNAIKSKFPDLPAK